MRVCFFGDSFVNGTGDDEALGWVGRVVAGARQRGRDVTGYNLGIRRDTSADVSARWAQEARLRLPAEHDGRLLFSFGANDCAHNERRDGPRLAAAESLARAQDILQAACAWLPTLMVGPAVLAGQADVNERIFALSASYRALCQRLAVPYLEICWLTEDSAIWADDVKSGDGVHPNRGGYALVADAVRRWSAWRAWVDSR